ncbi:ankyrin repeat domain-containing protein [Myxococcus xanthus]|uniref:Ankyrin repeat domain-containing protein n=1 Tax=Myxococcus xanthus TaxID=34 RepID=A0A7Y4IE01_MYXXA|nr:ankyrin repeat domain-containing protein [Myxococcus xanthus]NOJ77334.1 ankyrin repeat domain-containing protein [Myxococcus xanthus]NOJ84643.1 ankyrin repeat domain-containing protein [Myxococcus xanthus]
MTEQQRELEKLIQQIDDLHYIQTYHRVEMPEAEYRQSLAKAERKNAEVVAQLRALLAGGVSLDFETINGHSPMMLAVPQNNVEVIQLLMEYGADIRAGSNYEFPIHRAAEFGADRVVRFFIEQGIDPRLKTEGGRSVLSVARASRHSKNVGPLLVELLKKTKDQRGPPPKKAKELSEERVTQYLSGDAPAGVAPKTWEQLRAFMESVFVEEYSVTVDQLYAGIAEHGNTNAPLVFATIDLIRQVSTRAPASKTLKKVAKNPFVHHGDLVVEGPLKVLSLLVTGNLTVNGKASNFEGCQLFVGGDFECDTFQTEGPVIIGGSLKASTVDALYNDYSLDVRGVLTADRLVIEKHQVLAGRFDVKERIEK